VHNMIIQVGLGTENQSEISARGKNNEQAKTLIEVNLSPDKLNWGVYLNGMFVGWSKSSFDADFAAWQMAKLYDGAVVDIHPEFREFGQTEIDAARKVAKKSKEI